jgi:hypothetical protein
VMPTTSKSIAGDAERQNRNQQNNPELFHDHCSFLGASAIKSFVI